MGQNPGRRPPKRRGFLPAAPALCFALALALAALPAGFAGQGQQDISEFENRLSKINAEIKGLQGKLKEAEKREAGILSQLDRIAVSKKLLRTELALSTVQREKAGKELAAIQKNMEAQRKKLEQEQKAMERTLVTLYKFGRFNFFEFLLQAENVGTVFAESKHLSLLAGSQEKSIREYLKALMDMKTAADALEAKQAELSGIISAANNKRKELEAEEEQGRSLIQDIIRNKKTYEEAIREQNERAQQLESMMKKIAGQEIVLPFSFVPFYEKKGKLPWPIDGRVITNFGLQRHPQFNTVTLNNGIEVAPAGQNRVVQAVHSGKVVYADFFQGYGDLIIIDHGLNFYSLYGHLAEFLVQKGDLVNVGQSIGVAGDSGSLKGTCLYLEIRSKTKALDPLQWLKRR
jgi:septal ring factor EnvC (AmiA/AmiB activator)